MGLDEVLVECLQLLGALIPVEMGFDGFAGAAGEFFSEGVVLGECDQGIGEVMGAAGLYEQAIVHVLDHFGDATDGGGDAGELITHRFEQCDRHAFGERRKDEDIGVSKSEVFVVVKEGAGHFDV